MGIYSGRNEMSLSYNDLTLLRYIQKRQMIPLSKTALHFQKNESSIRRTIEQINLYSSEPMVRIEKSICYSCISYEDLVSFIRNLDQKDYLSSSDERIRVMITAIFFQNYVNSSKLYEQWGLSLTTKKQDTALLRQFLTRYGLELVTKKKKGLSIQGDELQLRFLVIDILHPLFEFTSENKVLARFANTPLEKQTYELATEYLSCSFQEATEILSRFLLHPDSTGNYLTSVRNRLVPKLSLQKIPAAFYLYYENTDCKRYICLLLQTAFGSFKHPFYRLSPAEPAL